MIPEAAVEAAFATLRTATVVGPAKFTHREMRLALEAAAPHMVTRVINTAINRAYEDGRIAGAKEAAAPHVRARETEWAIFRAQGGPNESPAAALRYKTREAAQRVVDASYSQPQYWEVRGHAVGEWEKEPTP